MAYYNQRQGSMSTSTVDINIDEIEASSSEIYRPPYNSDQTSSLNVTKVNTRSCLITLILIIIIITLLSIAALIIAIYTLASKTNNSNIIVITAATYSTTTANISTIHFIFLLLKYLFISFYDATATTSAVICSSSPSTSYTYSAATPSQCLNYTINTDATRNIAYTGSINYCDNVSPFINATSTWIRFEDPAGKVIANSPVPPNFCGTVATGWYAGQYPTAVFSTATSIVCFYQSSNTCAACTLISVTNCQTFYVFLLSQPQSCNYRYCTL